MKALIDSIWSFCINVQVPFMPGVSIGAFFLGLIMIALSLRVLKFALGRGDKVE